MGLAIAAAIAASFCMATSSVCQRLGARALERSGFEPPGFDIWLVFRLATQPAWVLGFAAMIAGFVLQVSALRLGPLALVQPILAVELLFVFGYLVVLRDPGDAGRRGAGRRGAGRRGAGRRDWLAAAAMSVGISVFLRAAAPSGGRQHAPAHLWWLGGLAALAAALLAIALAVGGSPTRRAACLGIGTGIGWGFVAAVIKELSSHVSGGPGAIFATWSCYALMLIGAAAMLLTSHAMAAGPLAASQPGFTIADPVTATMLGALLFDEHLRTTPVALAAEITGLLVLALGAWILSGSDLLTSESQGNQA
jgi:drug/metabolite transporter (DMT)-like permease